MPRKLSVARKESVADEESKVTAAPVEKEKKPRASKRETPKKEFEQTDRIKCRSITVGGLYVDGPRTKIPYTFENYGAVTEMEYRDLVALVHAKSDFIFVPCFVIDDPDFVAEFPQLNDFYAKFYDVKDLESILDLPVNEMMEKIKKLPPGVIDNLKIIAATQVSDGRLDSVKKIRELNDYFGIDLNFIADLNDN